MYYIMPSPNRFCDLDLLPVVLLKISTDSLISTIINTLNVSIETGIFPDSHTLVHVNPDESCAERLLEQL